MWLESCNIPDKTFSGLDITVPVELKSGIISETQSKLSECFIESLDLQSGSEKYLSFVKVVLQSIWSRGKYTKIDFNEDFVDYFISLTISAFKANNPKEYKRLRLNPQDSYIVINWVSINFHDKFEYYDPSVSAKPVWRPKWKERENAYISKMEREKNTNQYTLLQREWFTEQTAIFLEEDFTRVVMWDKFELQDIHLKRLQDFMEFLIDMETTWWTQLVNWVSTATSYTQTLNEQKASRSTWKYNSIDTRLRYAVMFYNWWNITKGSKNDILHMPNNENSEWIWDLWRYNQSWRNMSEFTFDSEVRLTLIYLFTKNSKAMRNIIMWKNMKQAAMDLYHEHHTNSLWHKDTKQRLSYVINKKEHYG